MSQEQQKEKVYRSAKEILVTKMKGIAHDAYGYSPTKITDAMEEYATQEVSKAEQMMRDEFESYKKEKDRQEGWTDEDMMQAWTAGWGPTYSDGFKEWLEDYKESKSRNNQQSK